MLTMTDEAGAHLAKLLDQACTQEEELAVRLVAMQRGLSFALDNIRPGDQALRCDGRTVLLLDEKISRTLEDRRLEVEPSPEGPQLLIR